MKLLLTFWVGVTAVLLLGFALAQPAAQDGAHNHPAIEQTLAAVVQVNHQQNTQIAVLYDILESTIVVVLPSPTAITLTPTPPPTWTRTPTATNTAQGDNSTPTTETLPTMSRTPTFVSATNTRTPTRPPSATPTQPTAGLTPTPAPTTAGDCAIWADFEANTIIKRRDAPSLAGTILTPSITPGVIEVVCYETLTETDINGLRWIKVSADREEWFAVGKQNGSAFEQWGVITRWR